MPEYNNEELTKNPIQVFSVHNWALKPNQTEGPPFTDHMKAIYNLDVPVDSKAPKPSSQTEEVPQGKKPRAKSGLRRKQSSKHTSESKTEASKSKTGQSEKETQSSLAKDKILSHPLPPTPVVGKMHKEAQQAVGGPTSLGATSEEGAHPQINSDISSQPEREHTKKDKGKKAMSSEEIEKESTNSGKHIHLTEEEINHQKKIEEDARAEAAKCESEVRKEELVDLLGPEVDPLDKLNDLATKKRKHADDIHDYFKANKRLKSSVQYKDHLAGIVLNEHVLGPGLDDHARTFSALLLAETDKRNLNPLKQMRTIEQLRQ
ncbi:hypothetical protein Tco_1283204 [Tanacetum coccineum]